MKGAIVVDDDNGEALSLSTRSCRDAEKWEIMPSLLLYAATLKVLDLHKARYLVHLNDSICQMIHLRTLTLTQCDRLVSLPEDIGALISLEEVNDIVVGLCHRMNVSKSSLSIRLIYRIQAKSLIFLNQLEI